MSLTGAKLICLNEKGEPDKSIPAKGRQFTIGYFMTCDHVLEHVNAKNIHCEINCDAFGRVTIHNMSDEHPISLNDKTITIKRPLLNGGIITILDKKYLWEFPKVTSSVAEDLNSETTSTPPKQVGSAEQPPNSCPDLKLHRDIKKRLTVHNFAYCIQSDEEGNTSIESAASSCVQTSEAESVSSSVLSETDNCSVTAENMPHLLPAAMEGMRQVTPEPMQNKSDLVLNLRDMPNINIDCTQNKEDIVNIPGKMKELLSCRQSDIVITSFSPREAGVRIEKSFTAIAELTTPRSVHSTPRGAFHRTYAGDGSLNFIDFSTPATPKMLSSSNSSMHVIDLTTPGKIKPNAVASSSPKSTLKPTLKKNLVKLENETLHESGISPLGTPVVGDVKRIDSLESVISVNSTDSSSVVEITDSCSSSCSTATGTASGAATFNSTPKEVLGHKALTPKRTPQSLRKRALLASAKKQGITPISTATNVSRCSTTTTPDQSGVCTPSTSARKIQFVAQRHSMSTPTRRTNAMSRLQLEGSPKSASQTRRSSIRPSIGGNPTTSTPFGCSNLVQRAALKTSPNLHKVRKAIPGTSLTSNVSKIRKSLALSMKGDASAATTSSSSKSNTKSDYIPSPANARARAIAASSIKNPQLTKKQTELKKTGLFSDKPNEEIAEQTSDLNRTFTLIDTESEIRKEALDTTFSPIKETTTISDTTPKVNANLNVTFSPEKQSLVDVVETEDKVSLEHTEPQDEAVTKELLTDNQSNKAKCQSEDIQSTYFIAMTDVSSTDIDSTQHSEETAASACVITERNELNVNKATAEEITEERLQQEDDDLLEQIEDVLNKSDELQKHLEEPLPSKTPVNQDKQDDGLRKLSEEFDETEEVVDISHNLEIQQKGEDKQQNMSTLVQDGEKTIADVAENVSKIISNSPKTPKKESNNTEFANSHVDKLETNVTPSRSSIVIEELLLQNPQTINKAILESLSMGNMVQAQQTNESTPQITETPINQQHPTKTENTSPSLAQKMPTDTEASPPKTPNLRGLKEMLKTPKRQKEPNTPTLKSVRNMLGTPKSYPPMIAEVEEQLYDGVSDLLQTPTAATADREQESITRSRTKLCSNFTPRKSARRASMSAESGSTLTPKRITKRRASISIDTEVATITPITRTPLRKHIFDETIEDMNVITEEKSSSPTMEIEREDILELSKTIEEDICTVQKKVPTKDDPKLNAVDLNTDVKFNDSEDICILKDNNPENQDNEMKCKIVGVSDYEYAKEIKESNDSKIAPSSVSLKTPKNTKGKKNLEVNITLNEVQPQSHQKSKQQRPDNNHSRKTIIKTDREFDHEKPSTSVEAKNNLNRLQFKTPKSCMTSPHTGKRCSTPLMDDNKDLTDTPTLSGTPIGRVSKFLIDGGLLPKPENLNSSMMIDPDQTDDEDEDEGLDKFFRTPRAKNMMVLTSPKSVHVKKGLDSVESELVHSEDYDLDSTNLNLDDMFKTPVATGFDDYIDNLNDTEGAAAGREEGGGENSRNLTPEEIFDSLVCESIIVSKTPEPKVYSNFRKLMSNSPSLLKSPFSSADIITDLPKSDIQEWVDSLENVEIPEDILDTSMNAIDDEPELSRDPLSISTTVLPTTDSVMKMKANTSAESMINISATAAPADSSSMVDPLMASNMSTIEQSGNRVTESESKNIRIALSEKDADMSGIDMLEQSEDSELSEPLLITDSEANFEKSLEEKETTMKSEHSLEGNLTDEFRNFSEQPQLGAAKKSATPNNCKPVSKFLHRSLGVEETLEVTIDFEEEKAKSLQGKTKGIVKEYNRLSEVETESKHLSGTLNQNTTIETTEAAADIAGDMKNRSISPDSDANKTCNEKPSISKIITESLKSKKEMEMSTNCRENTSQSDMDDVLSMQNVDEEKVQETLDLNKSSEALHSNINECIKSKDDSELFPDVSTTKDKMLADSDNHMTLNYTLKEHAPTCKQITKDIVTVEVDNGNSKQDVSLTEANEIIEAETSNLNFDQSNQFDPVTNITQPSAVAANDSKLLEQNKGEGSNSTTCKAIMTPVEESLSEDNHLPVKETSKDIFMESFEDTVSSNVEKASEKRSSIQSDPDSFTPDGIVKEILDVKSKADVMPTGISETISESNNNIEPTEAYQTDAVSETTPNTTDVTFEFLDHIPKTNPLSEAEIHAAVKTDRDNHKGKERQTDLSKVCLKEADEKEEMPRDDKEEPTSVSVERDEEEERRVEQQNDINRKHARRGRKQVEYVASKVPDTEHLKPEDDELKDSKVVGISKVLNDESHHEPSSKVSENIDLPEDQKNEDNEHQESRKVTKEAPTRRCNRRIKLIETHTEKTDTNADKASQDNNIELEVTETKLGTRKRKDLTTEHGKECSVVFKESEKSLAANELLEVSAFSPKRLRGGRKVMTASMVTLSYEVKDTVPQPTLTEVESHTEGTPNIIVNEHCPDSLKTSRGRTRKPTARAQQFLEEERAKASTPKRKQLIASPGNVSVTPHITFNRRGRMLSTIETESVACATQLSVRRETRGRKIVDAITEYNNSSRTAVLKQNTDESNIKEEKTTASAKKEVDDTSLNRLSGNSPSQKRPDIIMSTIEPSQVVISVANPQPIKRTRRATKVLIREAGERLDSELSFNESTIVVDDKEKPTNECSLDTINDGDKLTRQLLTSSTPLRVLPRLRRKESTTDRRNITVTPKEAVKRLGRPRKPVAELSLESYSDIKVGTTETLTLQEDGKKSVKEDVPQKVPGRRGRKASTIEREKILSLSPEPPVKQGPRGRKLVAETTSEPSRSELEHCTTEESTVLEEDVRATRARRRAPKNITEKLTESCAENDDNSNKSLSIHTSMQKMPKRRGRKLLTNDKEIVATSTPHKELPIKRTGRNRQVTIEKEVVTESPKSEQADNDETVALLKDEHKNTKVRMRTRKNTTVQTDYPREGSDDVDVEPVKKKATSTAVEKSGPVTAAPLRKRGRPPLIKIEEKHIDEIIEQSSEPEDEKPKTTRSRRGEVKNKPTQSVTPASTIPEQTDNDAGTVGRKEKPKSTGGRRGRGKNKLQQHQDNEESQGATTASADLQKHVDDVPEEEEEKEKPKATRGRRGGGGKNKLQQNIEKQKKQESSVTSTSAIDSHTDDDRNKIDEEILEISDKIENTSTSTAAATKRGAAKAETTATDSLAPKRGRRNPATTTTDETAMPTRGGARTRKMVTFESPAVVRIIDHVTADEAPRRVTRTTRKK